MIKFNKLWTATVCSILWAITSPIYAQETWNLRRCIEYALAHNITIKQQGLSVRQSQIDVSNARNRRLPSLNGSIGQNWSFGRGLTYENTYTNTNTSSTSFSLGTDIPIWDGKQMENNLAAARLGLEAALADLEKARESISIQIASAYLEMLYQKEMVEVCQRQLQLSKVQLQRINSLYKAGKKAEAEVAEAEATVANDELSLISQQNSLSLARLDLTQLLELDSPEGFDIATPTTEPDTLLSTPDATFADAAELRPQIRAEKYRLQNAERQVYIARAGFYPSLSFNAGLGSNYYTTSGMKADNFTTQLKNNFSQYLGLSLSIPIFNRFNVRNQVRSAKVQVENQQLTLENTRKSLYKEIQQAYYNAKAAQRQYASSQIALKASETSLKLAQKKFESGKSTATEYEEARTRFLKAQADLLQAKYTSLFRTKILGFYRGDSLY